MNTKQNKKTLMFLKLYLAFIIIQPLCDIISNLYNYDYIPINIITYFKPIFVFGGFLYTFFFIKYNHKKRQFLYYLLVAAFIVLHSILLYLIFTNPLTILHEFRFIINIIYFITIFLTLKNIYSNIDDKDYYYKKLGQALIISVSLYIILYLLAIITKTSWLTYEFSDSTKLGFRGWNYSGQIYGHLLCIASPFYFYNLFKLKINFFIKAIMIIVGLLPFLLIGTKVPYYIIIIVFSIYILVNIFIKIINKKTVIKISEISLSLIIIIGVVVLYKQLPVYKNTEINNTVANTESQEEDIKQYTENMQVTVDKNKENIQSVADNDKENTGNSSNSGNNNRKEIALEYEEWTLKSLEKLNELYNSGELHSSDNRNRQLYFMHYKFGYASLPFKLLGLGYLNQPNYLSMERDIIMPLYSFGIIGFILFTGILWILLIKTIVTCIKNIKKLNIETLMLAEGFCMFFFISFYAGATYIYTQFSIVLAIIMILLWIKLTQLSKNNLLTKELENITTKNYDAVVKEIEKKMINNEKCFIVTANPETIMLSQKNNVIKEILLNEKALKVPDGVSIVKACQKKGLNVKERITGCDLSKSLFELANKHKKTLYLFGAKKDVVESLRKKLEKDFPELKIVKTSDGYNKDREKVKKDILKLKPDVCLVALGIPDQELFINDIFDKVEKGIFMGVGGTFDVLSGRKKRAPKIFIKLNLEWLYRILTEPKRIKRFLKNNLRFLWKQI